MTTDLVAAKRPTVRRGHRLIRKLRVHFRHGSLYSFMTFAGRFRSFRCLIQWLARQLRPVEASDRLALPGVVMADVGPDEATRILRKDGLLTGLRLQETALSALRAALHTETCYGSGSPDYPFLYSDRHAAEQRYGRRFLQGHYYGLTKIPAVKQLASDAFLRSVAAGYFRATPKLVGIRAWWVFACDASMRDRANVGQWFHYDVDDYLALSAFFYLSDVEPTSGPHVAVLGTHQWKSARHIWKLSRNRTDAEILQTYGVGRVRTICGRAGEGFLEDPFCFHKGQDPTGGDRLVLQLRFALYDYGTGADSAHRNWLAADQV